MRKRSLSSGVCACLFVSGAATVPQGKPSASAGIEELRRFDRWLGSWAGKGWTSLVPGQRVEFQLREHVEKKAGDSVLLIEGRGVRKDDKGEEVVTHDGLALVYFDTKSGEYRWNGHDRGWGAVDAQVLPLEGGLEWTFGVDAHGTRVRFAIHFDEKHWREEGDLTTDGETWTRFMEMTLERE